MTAVANILLGLEVDRLDEATKSLNRAVNRLSLGMIMSALIIGGSYLPGSALRSEETRKR